ncbi:hypothetical protein TNCV_3534391 [Trichonephila clavipes]|nr:hypothetical protein TNCV_3534391 [Trichonephila clavipes]
MRSHQNAFSRLFVTRGLKTPTLKKSEYDINDVEISNSLSDEKLSEIWNLSSDDTREHPTDFSKAMPLVSLNGIFHNCFSRSFQDAFVEENNFSHLTSPLPRSERRRIVCTGGGRDWRNRFGTSEGGRPVLGEESSEVGALCRATLLLSAAGAGYFSRG